MNYCNPLKTQNKANQKTDIHLVIFPEKHKYVYFPIQIMMQKNKILVFQIYNPETMASYMLKN